MGGLTALWFLCFALVYGASFAVVCIINIGPLIATGHYGIAFMNFVLLLSMTAIFSEVAHLKDREKWTTAFLGALFFYGCYYNSVNGVSEDRDATSGDKAAKIESIGSWDAKIRDIEAQDRLIPTYTYTTETFYLGKKKLRDDAVGQRDRQCAESYIRMQPDRAQALRTCESEKAKAKKAQDDFDPVELNWGYTKAHKDNTDLVKQYETEKKNLGPKPTYADAAAGRIAPYLARFGVTEEGLRNFMPLYFAMLADLIFIFGTKYMMGKIDRCFASMWGEDWWLKKNSTATAKSEVAGNALPEVELSTLRTVHEGFETVQQTVRENPPTLQADEVKTLPPKLLMPPAEVPLKPARRESVGEWLANRLNPSKNRSIPAGEAYLWYCAYAREIGETPVTQTLFGRIMKSELKVEKRGGSSPTYLGIAPKPALVKASLIE